jgi:EmrB/QacA subfamily drug resistance transporter
MENLDGTIIVTATERMARSFGVPAADLNITIAAYLLTLGVFIPASGWMADRFGARTVFAGAIGLFTTASALCALSTSLGELTATRVLQGLGGAMMVPVGRLVVLRAADKRDLIKAVAYLTWPALAAPVIAPALGGVLTAYASWRWIFIVNIPLGAVALLVALRTVPNSKSADKPALDWLGFLLSGAGTLSLVGGIEAATDGVTWPAALATTAVGVALLMAAVRHLRRSAQPLVDLRLFSLPTFRVTNLGGSCFRMAVGAAPFLLPLLFEEAFRWNAFKAGLSVVPLFVGNIGVKPVTTPVLHRFKFRTVLITSCTAVSATFVLFATFTATTPLLLVATVLVCSGAFRSVGFSAFNTIVFADVPAEQMSGANTLTSTVQQLTMGLGVAIGALALSVGSRLAGAGGTGHGPFVVAFCLLACLPLLAAAESASLERHAGAQLTQWGQARS